VTTIADEQLIVSAAENVAAHGDRCGDVWPQDCPSPGQSSFPDDGHFFDECDLETDGRRPPPGPSHDPDYGPDGSVVKRTADCFWELRRLAGEIFRCLGCRPTISRLQSVYTCLILEDINSLFNELAAIRDQLSPRHPREAALPVAGGGFHPHVTSGTIFVTSGRTAKVRIAVLNNTAAGQTVRVQVLNNSVSPHAVLGDVRLEVASASSGLVGQSIGSAASYEIQVFDLVPGMTVSAVEETVSGSYIDGTKLTATSFTPNLAVGPEETGPGTAGPS
jgi:hypothetical protein